MQERPDIKSMNLSELTNYMEQIGEKKFRAKQIYEWIHKKHVENLSDMTNISKNLIARLEQDITWTLLKKEQVQISKADGTRKYLFLLEDNHVIESVLMRYKHGNSVCISTQVGCRMGCRFCASTLDGLVRCLTPAEMLEQIYRIEEDIGERVSNVVCMGTGEPLDNFDNVVKFIELLTDENGLNISQRNITVSTCGIVPKIKELADCQLAITLALSLHASNQEKRLQLMPIANKYDISEVIEACAYYFDKTKRRITFEYSLVGGVNDSLQEAEELVRLLKGLNCHVNLIPVNPIKERDFVSSNQDAIRTFKDRLEKNGLNVTIRREMGRDIDGACGQLRRRYNQEHKTSG